MTNQTKLYYSIGCNLIILIATIVIVASAFLVARKGSEKPIGKRTFRFFTTDSNIFSAVACGAALIFELVNRNMGEVFLPHWVILLKYYSAGTVMLTFVTVLFYLAPRYGFGREYSGISFYTHFAGPLLAVVTLLLFEKYDHISMEEMIVGFIPFAVYFWVYIRQVVLVAERDNNGNLLKGWEDFYGFNTGVNWRITTVAMTLFIIGIMVVLRYLYNK